MIRPVICFDSFLDYGILERHTQLDDTIDVLDMEVESYQLSKLMAWVFYPTWILLTIVQAICFILYNGKFHPLSKILDGCEVQRKGICLNYLDLFVNLKQLTLSKRLSRGTSINDVQHFLCCFLPNYPSCLHL